METFELIDGYDRRKTPARARYRYMTPDEARALTSGQEIPVRDRNGAVRRVRVSGKVRTWKRDATRVEVPCKYGFYESLLFVARGDRMEEWSAGVPLLVRIGDAGADK